MIGKRTVSKPHTPLKSAYTSLGVLLLFIAGLGSGCRDSGASDNDASVEHDTNGSIDTDSSNTDGRQDTGSETERDTRGPWKPASIDPAEMPTEVPTVEIVISDDDRASLESAPFYGEDVSGTFIDENGTHYTDVDINFRGAYALSNLINNDAIGRRNWKIKFPKDGMYRNRREWNFNFEPHLRQKLAYDLMKFAGVEVPNAHHVRLKVNGELQGLYLRYEDPDSKDWLWDKFGDDSGDLYKAALDLPASEGEPDKKYFADTTYLGDTDEAYRYHYNKKTNHRDPAVADDFSAIRAFLKGLDTTPSSEMRAWAEAHLDLDGFLSYLAVSNFIANWDSFPQRPKNFWLYENRRTSQLVFIPWDLDSTFDRWRDDFNQMGTEADIFFSLHALDYTPIHQEEGGERPLAWRILDVNEIEAAYIERYRELLDTILSEQYLLDRIDALSDLVSPHLTDTPTWKSWGDDPPTERTVFEDAVDEMRRFVSERAAIVAGQLAAQP